MKKRKIIIPAILSILACGSIAAGSTYALFTSESKVNVAITSGKVEVAAIIENFKTYSGKELTGNATNDEVAETEVQGTFTNGGTASLNDEKKTLTLENITPGDKVELSIKVKNNSNVKAKYRTVIKRTDNDGLFEGLKVTIGEEESKQNFYGFTSTSKYADLNVGSNEETIKVTIELPSDRGNEYQGKKCTLEYSVEAIQSNAKTEDPTDTVLSLYDKYDLIALDKYADEFKNSSSPLYTYRTFELESDIDLIGEDWKSINFSGQGLSSTLTFDGNNHTISNMTIKETTKNTGFFASGCNWTIKNLKFNNANISGINCVGVVVGHGMCADIENCEVKNSTVFADSSINTGTDAESDYNGDKVGAICGYLSAENNASIKNCKVESCTLKAYRDCGLIAGIASNSASIISGNTISGKNKLINDRITNNYKNFNEETTIQNCNFDDFVGRKENGYTLTNNEGTRAEGASITYEILK